MPLDPSRTINLYSIPVYDENVTESFTRDGSEAVRTILVEWANRVALINAIMAWPGESYSSAPWMYAQQIATEGEGTRSVGLDGRLAFEYQRLNVTYRPLDFNPTETGSDSLDFSAQAFTYPSDQPTFKWTGTSRDLPVEANPGKVVVTATLVRVRKNSGTLPTAQTLALAGKVNTVTVKGAPPGTLRYDGMAPQRRVFLGAAEAWDLTQKFSFNPNGWNKMFDPVRGGWYAIETKVGANPLYETADLSPLFA